MSHTVLASLAVVITMVNWGYYIWTIFWGPTKPHRISWFGWAVVGLLGVLSSFAGGAGTGAWVAAADAGVVSLVFLISLLPGKGKPGGHRFDYFITAIVLTTLLLWRLTDFPAAISATVAVATDLWFTWLTLRDTWKHPETEPLLSWTAAIVSNALAVLALEDFSYAAVLFPAYLLFVTVLISVVIIERRKDLHKKPHDEKPIIY